jgi:uncharacterized protein (TIGR00369 family)
MKTPCAFINYLGVDVVRQGEGSARLEMPFREELTNPPGFVHGGAIASLVDGSMAVALVSLVGHGEFATARMDIRFRSATKGQTLVCESEIESNRGKFYFGKATVREEGGKVVAEAQSIFSVPEGR